MVSFVANGPERLDEAAEFNQLHALGRHDPLTGGAADRAIVVMAGAGSDQRRPLVGIDTVMPEYFHSDFRDAIRTGANITAEDRE